MHFSVLPPPPATNYSHNKCYLARLRDCSPKISREHTQTRSVLKAISGNEALSSGLTGQLKGKVELRSLKSKTAKVLCERHNNSLSVLDSVGKRFLESIVELARFTTPENAIDKISSFHTLLNGHSLERWVLKSLIGMIAANGTRFRDQAVKDYEIPDYWTQVLVGDKVLQPPHGLYFRADLSDDSGVVTEMVRDYGIRPLWDHNTAKIVGVELRLMSSDYVLWLDENGRGTRPDLGVLQYRPSMWYGVRQPLTGIIEFSWEISGKGAIELMRPEGLPTGHHDFNKRWHHYGESYDSTMYRFKASKENGERDRQDID